MYEKTFKFSNGGQVTVHFLDIPPTADPMLWRELAEKCLGEACLVADDTGIGFSWDIAYGMGGYYTPVPKPTVLTKADALALIKSGKHLTEAERSAIANAIENGEATVEDWDSSSDYGWNSSSNNC